MVKKKTETTSPVKKARQMISQSDIPSSTLEKALRVAQSIYDNYGKDPARPLQVAKAMSMSPASGPFKMLTGAAIAYGLTAGGYNAATISLTPLARRILSPTKEGDDFTARKEAILKPKIISTFLQKYDRSPLPSEVIARNVLEEEMSVPKDRSKAVLDLILEGAKAVGFLTEIKGKEYVDLQGTSKPQESDDVDDPHDEEPIIGDSGEKSPALDSAQVSSLPKSDNLKKVFITHGKNQLFLEPIKKLLSFGGFEPVVAMDKQTVSQPVPEKVMESMRTCGAAIIHIDVEQKLIDGDAKEHVVLNPNVLIEIGAAMGLYGKRFILLVKQGVSLPSNLQGLYEVRYSGETLDSDVTIKLLEAINDIKNHPLP